MSNRERSRKHDVSYGKFFQDDDEDDDFVTKTTVKQPSKQQSMSASQQPRGEKRKSNADDENKSKTRPSRLELMPVLERFDNNISKDAKRNEKMPSNSSWNSLEKPPKISPEVVTYERTKSAVKSTAELDARRNERTSSCSSKSPEKLPKISAEAICEKPKSADPTGQVNFETPLKKPTALVIADDHSDEKPAKVLEESRASSDRKVEVAPRRNQRKYDKVESSDDDEEEQDSEQENQKDSTVRSSNSKSSKIVPPSPTLSTTSGRSAMQWKPPAVIGGGGCQKSKSVAIASCISPNTGLRLGLSRNAPKIKPLHANVKIT